MLKVLVTGAGKIGTLIAVMLAASDDYQVHIADVSLDSPDCQRLYACVQERGIQNISFHQLDVSNESAWADFIKNNKVQAVISSLPYFLNPTVAKMARQYDLHYFDLTEDTSVTAAVKTISQGATTAFVPQCGLAPGFISIAAKSLMQHFDQLDTVKLRVGALPQTSSNALFYALTWSTDGVINEYGNPCYEIADGQPAVVMPLEGLETVIIDGIEYEAFNTSGGLGSLAELSIGKVNKMNYKTLRYPGHCEKMKMLMTDLKLNQDRPTLKRILENAIPKTVQDVVVVYISVSGYQHGTYLEETYSQKIVPAQHAGLEWTAIQMSTASGICAVADMILTSDTPLTGLIYQEKFQLKDFLANRFGRLYQSNNQGKGQCNH